MSLPSWVVGVPLWGGVTLLVTASLAAAIVGRPYDRLHFVGLAATVGAPLVVLALVFRAGDWATVVKLVLIGGLLLATGPVTSAVTARAQSRVLPPEDRR